jgi:hypothetical protein
MIFKGDNFNDRFKGVAFLPWIALSFLIAAILGETNIYGKVFCLLISFILFYFPIKSFLFNRYSILFLEDEILIKNNHSRIEDVVYSYYDLVLISIRQSKVVFKFKNKKKYFIDLDVDNRKFLIPLVLHVSSKNKNIKIESIPINGYYHKLLKKELYMSSLIENSKE